MEIHVTQRDIDRGAGSYADACPITLAVRRRLVLPWGGVITGVDQVTMVRTTEWVRAPLPQEARDFVKEFDEGSPVQPFTFAITDGSLGSDARDSDLPVAVSSDGSIEADTPTAADVARWNEFITGLDGTDDKG